ncbi:uncharacterized protein LOC142817601 [Rhipicephalus microplus]|uniref:uncharacterized protein LOC142817601 n=1 Tax=Rhipicephalus microplus TaxID=6941 RepID=UPI003F6BDA7E
MACVPAQILFPDETPCDTAGCEQEVFRLTGNLDKNEQPCHQLYAFVCGGVKWTPQGGNTLAEVHAANLARLNDTLHSAATKKCATIQAITMRPTFCELSTLYTSCHALYSVEKDLHDTMYAYLTDVGVNVSAWLIHANSTNKLLDKIVEQSLKFDVPSVLWLRLNPDSGLLSVEPARPLFSGPILRECAEHEDQEQLMQKVVSAIDEVTQNVDELAHDLGHLHTELSAKFVPRKETVIMKMQEAFYFLNASQLRMWLRIFTRHLPHRSAARRLRPDSVALFKHPHLLHNVTNAAFGHPVVGSVVSLGNLFALSTLLQPIFEWEYQRHLVVEEQDERLEAVRNCAKMAREVLPKTWIQFSTRALVQDRRDFAELRRMAQTVLEGVRNDYRMVVRWRTQMGKVEVLEHLNVLRWRLPDERDYDYDWSSHSSPLLRPKPNR